MYAPNLPYRRALRLSVHLVLTVLIGFGAMIPQAAAHLGCSHPCCMAPAAAHMQHEPVRIAGPAQPSCCAQEPSDSCRLCTFENYPLPDLAFQKVQSEGNQAADNISAARWNPLPGDAAIAVGSRQPLAAELHFTPLYIQTHTLLI